MNALKKGERPGVQYGWSRAVATICRYYFAGTQGS